MDTQTFQDITSLFKQFSTELAELTISVKRAQQASIPLDIDERFYSKNDVTIRVPAQTTNQVRILTVLVTLTSAGVLTVGDRAIALAAGTYNWTQLKWILSGDDVRTLTQTTPGAMSLELIGESLVNSGVF